MFLHWHWKQQSLHANLLLIKETDPTPRVTFLYPQCILIFLKLGLSGRKRGGGGGRRALLVSLYGSERKARQTDNHFSDANVREISPGAYACKGRKNWSVQSRASVLLYLESSHSVCNPLLEASIYISPSLFSTLNSLCYKAEDRGLIW